MRPDAGGIAPAWGMEYHMGIGNYRVIVSTQFMENYGAHDWDGKGECPQHWKYKGGSDRVVAESATPFSPSEASALAHSWEGVNSDYCREYMLGWSVISPGEETMDERRALEMAEWRGDWERVRELREAKAEALAAREAAMQAALLEHEAHGDRLHGGIR